MKVTLQSASESARTLASKYVTHFQSKLYLNTQLNQKLNYSLPSSSLSEYIYIQMNKTRLLQAIFSMGINRTWPLAFRFGWHHYGGLQLKYIEGEELTRELRSLHDMLHKTNTSKVNMILLKYINMLRIFHIHSRMHLMTQTMSIVYGWMILFGYYLNTKSK